MNTVSHSRTHNQEGANLTGRREDLKASTSGCTRVPLSSLYQLRSHSGDLFTVKCLPHRKSQQCSNSSRVTDLLSLSSPSVISDQLPLSSMSDYHEREGLKKKKKIVFNFTPTTTVHLLFSVFCLFCFFLSQRFCHQTGSGTSKVCLKNMAAKQANTGSKDISYNSLTIDQAQIHTGPEFKNLDNFVGSP